MAIYLLIPLISAAIGWFTNYLAIKMLFHPKKPIKLLFFQLQGIFPKRKQFFAHQFGRIISQKLIKKESLKQKINNEETQVLLREEIMKEAQVQVDEMLSSNMLFKLAGSQLRTQIEGSIEKMVDGMLPKMTSRIDQKIDNLDMETMVSQKIQNFSNEQFEELLMSVIRKELMFVEFAGAVLGFLIGLLQVAFIIYKPL